VQETRQNESYAIYLLLHLCRSVYLSKTPSFVPAIFKALSWTGPSEKGQVYLTFDDGPHPEHTAWAMDQLEAAGGRGTFFVVGENVDQHPTLFAEIQARGHSVGNHTQSHNSGWASSNFAYLRSYLTCQKKVASPLFRPPFGRISNAQAQAILKRSRVVMWDVLSGDFDTSRSPASCVEATLKAVKPGSIVVLHDSEKAAPRMRAVLPALLEHLAERGWTATAL
jgi:peptidoglycan/xylan/chitin deacetylase (PgdA/CDA1 family)